MEIIFNEKKYIEQILNTNVVPDDLSINRLIVYIGKYFFYDGIKAKELSMIIASTLDSFNLDTIRYRPFKYDLYIKNIAKQITDPDCYTPPLRDYDSIPLYKNELDKIRACPTRRHQKLLATLIFLARYNYNNGYTTASRRLISKLSNINASKKDLDLIAHDLIEIEGSPFKGMNYNSNKACTWIVDLSNEDDEVIYAFTEPNNIGNQVITLLYPEYITCSKCGRLVRKKGTYDNRKKYCSKCAADVNREQTRERMKIRYHKAKDALKTI